MGKLFTLQLDCLTPRMDVSEDTRVGNDKLENGFCGKELAHHEFPLEMGGRARMVQIETNVRGVTVLRMIPDMTQVSDLADPIW